MTDPADYTAKIRAKGLDSTGVTEQLAAEMFRNKGRHYIAIVELRVDETHEKADGARKVDLVLTQVEPANSVDLEEHLRELTRVGYLNRQRADGQLAIDESLGSERTVADVLASGKSHRPHPFIVVDASQENPICDVCGGIEASAVHSTQDVLDDPDTEDEGDSDEQAQAADPYDYVHAKGGNLPGEETVCALHATVNKNLHTHDDHDQVTCPDCLEQLAIDASFDEPQATRPLTAVPDPFTTPA